MYHRLLDWIRAMPVFKGVALFLCLNIKNGSSKLMDGEQYLILMCEVMAVMGFFVLWHN